jgi:hypothetical protein
MRNAVASLVLLFGTTAVLSASNPTDRNDPFIDRLIANEHQTIKSLAKDMPLVETYLQFVPASVTLLSCPRSSNHPETKALVAGPYIASISTK